jgi:hypothetical protein
MQFVSCTHAALNAKRSFANVTRVPFSSLEEVDVDETGAVLFAYTCRCGDCIPIDGKELKEVGF